MIGRRWGFVIGGSWGFVIGGVEWFEGWRKRLSGLRLRGGLM